MAQKKDKTQFTDLKKKMKRTTKVLSSRSHPDSGYEFRVGPAGCGKEKGK